MPVSGATKLRLFHLLIYLQPFCVKLVEAHEKEKTGALYYFKLMLQLTHGV